MDNLLLNVEYILFYYIFSPTKQVLRTLRSKKKDGKLSKFVVLVGPGGEVRMERRGDG